MKSWIVAIVLVITSIAAPVSAAPALAKSTAKFSAKSSAKSTASASAQKTATPQSLPVSKTTVPGANKPIRDKWAVVIGIDKFKDKRIPSLQYSSKDARDFADFLVKEGNFAPDHILLLTNEEATENAIQRAVGDDWLPRRVLEDDVVIVFASTHGSPKEMDVAGENFLVTYDTDVDNLFSSAIELQDLATTIRRRTMCDRVIVLLDACNSGAAEVGGKGLSRSQNFEVGSIAGEGTIVISSSKANERSWESKRYQNGVFTHNLMSALKCKGAQTRLSDAYEALRDLVAQEVQFDRRVAQNPEMKMRWNGSELAMLAPPARPRKTESYSKEASAAEAAATPVVAPVKQQARVSVDPVTFAPASMQTAPAITQTAPASTTQATAPTSKQTTVTSVTSPVPAAKAIGIAPFGAVFEKIVTYSSQGVLWGVINSPDELTDLPFTLGDKVEAELTKHVGARVGVVSQYKTGDELRKKFPALEKVRYLNLTAGNETSFKAIGEAVSMRYLLTGVVDEIMWRPTKWSNRYTFVVSAQIIDLQTGMVEARVDRLTISKAPMTSDKGGGKKYFENEVVPDAAKQLVSALAKQMNGKW
ncbi:MAG: caspase family protein [Candidatus Melainabacteria bacterium]|nr:caspase family protein [Candidatus Melainabacteria bacterium]